MGKGFSAPPFSIPDFRRELLRLLEVLELVVAIEEGLNGSTWPAAVVSSISANCDLLVLLVVLDLDLVVLVLDLLVVLDLDVVVLVLDLLVVLVRGSPCGSCRPCGRGSDCLERKKCLVQLLKI